MTDATQRSFLSRRAFLAATPLAALTAAAACSPARKAKVAPTTSVPSSVLPPANDSQAAAFAAGVELMAAQAYEQAIAALNTGQLAPVAPALAEFVNAAHDHHRQHLDAWNGWLRANGGAEITDLSTAFKRAVQSFRQTFFLAGVGKMALGVEPLLAASYVSAAPALIARDAAQLAGSILVVEMQHASIIRYLTDEDFPVPDTFASDAFSLPG
jgi:hypothetical protein